MSAKINSCAVVGLADAAVQESCERVRSAIKNFGLQFPIGHVTVYLAPADLRKEGLAYDLPIAVAILAACAGYAPHPCTFMHGTTDHAARR